MAEAEGQTFHLEGMEQSELSKRLYRHVATLAKDIGVRSLLSGPETLVKAVDYITAEWEEQGYQVRNCPYLIPAALCQRLDIRGGGEVGVEVNNLEVTIPGTVHPEEIVIIGAHYDSFRSVRPDRRTLVTQATVGADDNASGVATILEISRQLAGQSLDRTVRFVAFTNEEPPFFGTPYRGSRVYVQETRKRGENVVAMICLDAVGFFSDEVGSQRAPRPLSLIPKRFLPGNLRSPEAGNFLAFVGDARSAFLARRVAGEFAANCEIPAFPFTLHPVAEKLIPGLKDVAGWSDHGSFWEFGIPAVMITDTAFLRNPDYHTPFDVDSRLDYPKMAEVVKGLIAAVCALGRS